MSKVFEPAMLPLAEKERMVRELLDEFGLRVHSHSAHRHELIIPCRLGSAHRNQDREPTAAINYEKLTSKCLGCGAGGGLLWFIAEYRGTTSTEARKWLAEETGTDGQVQDLSNLLRYFDSLYSHDRARPPLPAYAEKTLEPWALIHPWVVDPPEYDAQGRNMGGWGIPEETVIERRVGYAEHYSMGKDKPTSERIIIPHFWKGRLVGWQSRRIANDGTPKYKSTPDFPKDSTIYNYAPESNQVAVVVESPKSALRHLHHLHIPATFGKDVTETQVKLLGRYPKVVFWFDNDPGGWGAYEDLKDRRGNLVHPGVLERTSRFTEVWAVASPYDADPADLSDEVVDDLVREAVPWPVWTVPDRLLCPRCEKTTHEGGCS